MEAAVYYNFDPSFLDISYNNASRHVRSSSKASSIYSTMSAVDSTAESAYTGLTTPPRASPPVIHSHGPRLLPKIRSQDQELAAAAITPSSSQAISQRMTPPATVPRKKKRATHARSFTNPETLSSMVNMSSMSNMAFAHMSSYAPGPVSQEQAISYAAAPASSSLMCSPMGITKDMSAPRRASTCSAVDAATDNYGFPPSFRPMSFVTGGSDCSSLVQNDASLYQSYAPRETSPLSMASTPDPTPSTTLMAYLTAPSPAASLVRSISMPLRGPNIKHYWWDVRNIRPWTGFNLSTVLNLPGAMDLLNTPVPAPLLPEPTLSARHPETEASLHSIYASYYLPKLNSALAISSHRPLQLSVPTKMPANMNDLLFVANAAGDSATAAAMFGGKPSARVVGIVRTFDRFNTTMRLDGNIKRVEYLRGLSAIHHAMREHNCRYGFILTEIELVLVRNGTEATPFFGELDITSVQLNVSAPESDLAHLQPESVPLTACLALWGLCQIAGDDAGVARQATYKADIGAPAEGTRRKARARDSWIPQPQLAEKREAKRSRGWVWPEDAIGKKEMGKRGVKYANM